jgi:glutamate/tyrosine decarboxylase-like PLP-dependent enzyme
MAGAADELALELPIRRADGSPATITELPLWELLNIPPGAALDAWDELWRSGPRLEVERAVANHTLAAIGYQEYSRRLALAYGDPLSAGVVVAAANAHYSWEKIVRALGIGSNQLMYVPVDRQYRMNPDALWEQVRELGRHRQPILACVSVCGSTEESAVDRLDQILAVRARAEQELGVTFQLHSDACYGGYAAAVTRKANGTRRSAGEIRADLGSDWPSDEWVAAISALAGADSVAVDPHKLGYVPYAAGAILVRDRRVRELVATEAPYLLPTPEPKTKDLFLGRFIFEGSKPGASAAAVWLSHKVLPLDERGYGYLISRTVAGARRLYEALSAADLAPFRVVLLPKPDINIVCFVLSSPGLGSLEALNAFNERVYEHMSITRPDQDPDYIITRTRLRSPMYDGAVEPLLDALGVCSTREWKASGGEGLVVLRSTVMDPFLVSPPPAPDHVAGFVGALRRAGEAAAGEISRAWKVGPAAESAAGR